jgi:hypothetical protein
VERDLLPPKEKFLEEVSCQKIQTIEALNTRERFLPSQTRQPGK